MLKHFCGELEHVERPLRSRRKVVALLNNVSKEDGNHLAYLLLHTPERRGPETP
jgi:hypothetical protein